MKAHNIDEGAAYALLRKAAMGQGKRMADIVQQLVMAAELLAKWHGCALALSR